MSKKRIKKSDVVSLMPQGREAYFGVRQQLEKYPRKKDRDASAAKYMGNALAKVVDEAELLQPPLPEETIRVIGQLVKRYNDSIPDLSSYDLRTLGPEDAGIFHTGAETQKSAKLLWLAGEVVFEHAYGSQDAQEPTA